MTRSPKPPEPEAAECRYWADGKHAFVTVGWRPSTKSCECGAFVRERNPRAARPLRSVEDFD